MASVPAFCQQRQKLLPETMDFLFHSFNDSFSSLETYRGFRLLACDKSDLAIAYTPDDKDTYRRHNSLERHEKGYNQLHLNAVTEKGLIEHKIITIIILTKVVSREYLVVINL